MSAPEVTAAVLTTWDPDRCGCRWGEQPCDLCLPVLDARSRERQTEALTTKEARS